MLPDDPRFENLDQELMEIAGESFLAAGNVTMIHLRDARMLLPEARDTRIFAKACVVLASAALESNLMYLSELGLAFAKARPDLYVEAQCEFLRGERTAVDDNGNLVQKRLRQTLEERLRIRIAGNSQGGETVLRGTREHRGPSLRSFQQFAQFV